MTDTSLISTQETLGSIAVRVPEATAVFRRWRLDFCCGGDRSLEESCAAKQLDLEAIAAELQALQQQQPLPDAPTPVALIDHILQRYHEVHRNQLPELIRMARRVEAVHREHPAVPRGLADHLEAMEQELLEHMAKEEQVLFPILKRGGHPMVVHPIAVMREEHNHHGQQIERLNELTSNQQAPADACTTWRALYSGSAKLVDDLMEHIHLENNLLFRAFA